MRKPLVGVISDRQMIGQHLYHTAGDKYLRALSEAAGVLPVILPSLGDGSQNPQAIEEWLAQLDGVFLSGAYAMLDPALYRQAKLDQPFRYDAQRDQFSQRLIPASMRLGLPLLGACRGLQEINVACGGSLHQCVQAVPGLNDHREDLNASLDQQYAPAHSVSLVEEGLLSRITGESTLMVNSLHTQGIDQLGDGLSVEARAADGLIEALRIDCLQFGLAVQWHPEWKPERQGQLNPQQGKIFSAFGDACRSFTHR